MKTAFRSGGSPAPFDSEVEGLKQLREVARPLQKFVDAAHNRYGCGSKLAGS